MHSPCGSSCDENYLDIIRCVCSKGFFDDKELEIHCKKEHGKTFKQLWLERAISCERERIKQGLNDDTCLNRFLVELAMAEEGR